MSENRKDSEDPDSILARDVENFRLSHPEIEIIELSTVRGTRLRFPEANQAAPSFVRGNPVNRTYTQPYTSSSDLIPLLQERGLIVEDTDLAQEWIEKVGYPMQQRSDTKSTSKKILVAALGGLMIVVFGNSP